MATPFAIDVLERTLGGEVRLVELGDRTVVRSVGRPDHVVGNAVHLHGPVDADALLAAMQDTARRLQGHLRLVVPLPDDVDAAPLVDAARSVGAATRVDHLVTLQDPVAASVGAARRPDLVVAPPADDRAWHGLTVLHRHAGPADRPDTDPSADRGRGADDDLLRWWAGQLHDLVLAGRARVMLAQRFGTPVAAGALVWDPRVDVGPGHAGLAVLTDVVVHPAHRGLGIARHLVADLLETHLADFPTSRVVMIVPAALAPHVAGGSTLTRLLVVSGG